MSEAFGENKWNKLERWQNGPFGQDTKTGRLKI